MSDDKLIDIVPYTKKGEAGCRIIIRAVNYDAWIIANAERLKADGYVNIIVEDHKPTVAFGDKRQGRR
jgi:hypothetical protein